MAKDAKQPPAPAKTPPAASPAAPVPETKAPAAATEQRSGFEPHFNFPTAGLKGPPPEIEPGPPAPLRRWLVTLVHHKDRVVEAADEAGAWEAFKRLNGIIASDHPYTVTPAES